MRIKTTGQINARTQDGREVTADEGSVVEIDDEDAAMVGLAKSLIMSGQAEHYGDAGAIDDSQPVEEIAEDLEADLDVDADDADAEHYVDEADDAEEAGH